MSITNSYEDYTEWRVTLGDKYILYCTGATAGIAILFRVYAKLTGQ